MGPTLLLMTVAIFELMFMAVVVLDTSVVKAKELFFKLLLELFDDAIKHFLMIWRSSALYLSIQLHHYLFSRFGN